ncbi:MAG: helix-turn-helix domain-containing protein [Actinomycetota bacterium]
MNLKTFIRAFEANIPHVAKDITDRIWSEIPGYSALEEPGQRQDVEEAARRNVSAFVMALADGRELTKRDIDELGVVGEVRAYQGVPLEEVLRAFRMVGRVLWDHLGDELAGPDGPGIQAIVSLGGTLMRFTDQISSSVAQHYEIAQRRLVRRHEEERGEFLHDLLLGTYASSDTMVARAREFGFDLTRSHLAIVGVGEDLALFRALDAVIEKLRGVGQPLVHRRAGQAIGLCAMAATASAEEFGQTLMAELDDSWSIGLGGPYPGIEGCRQSYLEAREALEIGKAFEPDRRVYGFQRYLVYGLLRSDQTLAQRFVDELLGPIIEHDTRRKSELIDTLDAYFATDGSAKETGLRLYAHPHTVSYRLKQIEKLTGRSLGSPEDKLQLHLALKALRLMQT